jgi:hypothetical protein
MKYPRYEYSAEAEMYFFEFKSIGPKGTIKKVVQYSEMSVVGYYNLAFGDYDETINDIDDEVITNNNDARKVLSTVVSTVYAFTGKYPDAKVFATGSSEARTRLYRMGISNNLDELKTDFQVFGMNHDGVLEEFIVGEDYIGFLVTRKNKNFTK